MRKANVEQEPVAATVQLTPKQIREIKVFLNFPIDIEDNSMRKQIIRAQEQNKNTEMSIEDYKRAIVERRELIKKNGLLIRDLETKLKPKKEASEERALEEVLAAAKLPWIEDIWMESQQLRIKTRVGMLKTRLNTRIVDFGKGVHRVEYVSEPAIVPMPQYELSVLVTNMGEGSWANTISRLGIRLLEARELNSFAGGKVMAHQPRAHWAAQSVGHMNWSPLCLGEYDKDLQQASARGLSDFLIELASYLQTCGDGHAYVRKEVWALSMGNPAYNPHAIRKAKKDETVEQVEERYRRDYKTVNAVEFKEGTAVNPADDVPFTGGITMEHVRRAFNAQDWPGFGHLTMAANGPAAERLVVDEVREAEQCDCINNPEDYEDCDCDAECGCHMEYV